MLEIATSFWSLESHSITGHPAKKWQSQCKTGLKWDLESHQLSRNQRNQHPRKQWTDWVGSGVNGSSYCSSQQGNSCSSSRGSAYCSSRRSSSCPSSRNSSFSALSNSRFGCIWYPSTRVAENLPLRHTLGLFAFLSESSYDLCCNCSPVLESIYDNLDNTINFIHPFTLLASPANSDSLNFSQALAKPDALDFLRGCTEM